MKRLINRLSDFSPQAIAERAVKKVEPYFEKTLKEYNMKKEKQDKLWAEHSKNVQRDIIERYESYDTSVPVLKALKESLEYTYGKHNLLPTLTYKDVARELFEGKDAYYSIANGIVQKETNCRNKLTDNDLCTSEQQVYKIEAINRLLNVAKFLNKNEDGSDWVLTIEDWEDMDEDFYTLGVDPDDNEIHVIAVNKLRLSTEIVYFRTKEIALQAVQILGADVIRTALTTKY